MWRKGNSYMLFGGKVNWCSSYCGKQYGSFSKKYHMTQQFHCWVEFLGIYLKKNYIYIYIYSWVYI